MTTTTPILKRRCLVPKFLDLPLVVEPVAELFKAFLKGFLGIVPAVVDPFIEQSFKQSLNLPVLPRASRIYFVMEDELSF